MAEDLRMIVTDAKDPKNIITEVRPLTADEIIQFNRDS